MKFNAGDRVLVLNHNGTFEFLEYLSNPFWFKEKVLNVGHLRTIKAANEHLCSFYEDKIPEGHIAGSNEYAYYRQDGRCLSWCNREMILHFDKDIDQIRTIITGGISKEKLEVESRIAKEIESLEYKIQNLKNNGDEYSRTLAQTEAHVVELFMNLGLL